MRSRVNNSGFDVLVALLNWAGHCTLNGLSEDIGIGSNTLIVYLELLEDAGYVVYKGDEYWHKLIDIPDSITSAYLQKHFTSPLRERMNAR